MDIPSIREYSDIVEQYSIDEAFVNMTASVSGDVLGLTASKERYSWISR